MSDHPDQEKPRLELIETVRCLECGGVYAKPTTGGTAQANPGCPECGYVGWLKTSVPVTEASEQLRFALGHLRHRSA